MISYLSSTLGRQASLFILYSAIDMLQCNKEEEEKKVSCFDGHEKVAYLNA